MRTVRGLSLIELVVVVAIISVIAAIVYPMYTSQSQSVRRAEAKAALQQLAQAEERYYTLNGEYAATLASLGLTAATDRGYYNLSIVRGGSENEQFTATASAAGMQSGDTDCQTMTIDQQGDTTPANDCW